MFFRSSKLSFDLTGLSPPYVDGFLFYFLIAFLIATTFANTAPFELTK